MFLQKIRSSAELIQEVFGDETETTKQSILAAKKWRTLTDDEKQVNLPPASLSFFKAASHFDFSTQPFLAQAEREKMEYEIARREYEDRMAGIETISTSFPRPFPPAEQTQTYASRMNANDPSPMYEAYIHHRDEGYASDSADETKFRTQ
jgi:membrane-bound lytic murein transglycosylase B